MTDFQRCQQAATASLCPEKGAALLGNEYTIGVLIPLALVALYWLVEVSA